MPTHYRLATVVLDATGMRVGELEAMRWADIDQTRGRWRILKSKSGRMRWVTPRPDVLTAVLARVPREDRAPEARVFAQVRSEKLRAAMARAHGRRRPGMAVSQCLCTVLVRRRASAHGESARGVVPGPSPVPRVPCGRRQPDASNACGARNPGCNNGRATSNFFYR
jgi:hypothetical protein